jgi:hypothetical protein
VRRWRFPSTFQKAGDRGTFEAIEPPGSEDGHNIALHPELWRASLGSFLDAVDRGKQKPTN